VNKIALLEVEKSLLEFPKKTRFLHGDLLVLATILDAEGLKSPKMPLNGVDGENH